MKKAEGYLRGLPSFNEEGGYGKFYVLEAIRAAQVDAYNKAIEDAAKNAKTKDVRVNYTGVRAGGSYFVKEVDKESILELKKRL